MSFSYQVKTELCREPLQRSCCALAEAYGVLLYGNTFTPREVRLVTGNSAFVDRLPRLFRRAFQMEFDKVDEGRSGKKRFSITVTAFGYKYGLPMDADLVFDVRFLPNPYYVQELRPRTGLDDGVRDYVFSGGAAGEFLEKLQDLVGFLLPKYVEEGKTALVVAVGCTGGHHRSVAIAHALAAYIRGRGYPVTESHRDLGRT